MSAQPSPPPDFVIAHATDLAADGGVAFAHGVALARDAGARLVSLHANPAAGVAARDLPTAAELLKTWHANGGAEPVAVDHHRQTHDCCEDPVDTLLDAMRALTPDLLVVGTHRVSAMGRLFKGSVSEALALNSGCPTLFLPIGEKGFVDVAGRNRIQRVLVPVGDAVAAERAVETITRLATRCRVEHVDFHLLHIGAGGEVLERLTLPEGERWTWHRHQAEGPLTQVINRFADELSADVVVMATAGHDSVVDMLKGSHTEQVLRKAHCPVLSVPIG